MSVKYRLHVVAGIPGTRVRESLKRIEQHVGERPGAPVKWVSVEEHLDKVAEPFVRQQGAQIWGTPLAKLLLPRPLLRQLWQEAFASVWRRVEQLLGSSHVIVTLHLCYFLHRTREYFSPVDLKGVGKTLGQKAHAVVTLIDDIFDCHRHLYGGVCDVPESHDQSIIDLLRILDWRSKENLLADLLARSWGRPHFVFAVKHPIDTFLDLLYTDKTRVYLSHPISELRRKARSPELVGGVRAEIQRIRDVIARLGTRHVVFEPTSIDELRFRRTRDAHGHEDAALANLDPRWPFEPEARKVLYVSPSNPPNEFSFPIGWEQDEREEIAESPLLSELREGISRQINARDHALVEQTDMVACYRPIYEGHVSSGVQEELRHVKQLVQFEVREREPVGAVYCPNEDREAYPFRQLQETLLHWYRKRIITGPPRQTDLLLQGVLQRQPELRLQEVLSGDPQALIVMLTRYNLAIARAEGDESVLSPTPQAGRHVRATELAAAIGRFNRNYLDEFAEEKAVQMTASEPRFLEMLGC